MNKKLVEAIMMNSGHECKPKFKIISTKQQRQGVEMAGLGNDVQKGNRINEENSQMLRNMMQHLHLQVPPYGPQ